MTRKKFIYGVEQPELIPRIACTCGMYNNKPSKKTARRVFCKKCGKLVDPRERFLKEMRDELGKKNK